MHIIKLQSNAFLTKKCLRKVNYHIERKFNVSYFFFANFLVKMKLIVTSIDHC